MWEDSRGAAVRPVSRPTPLLEDMLVLSSAEATLSVSLAVKLHLDNAAGKGSILHNEHTVFGVFRLSRAVGMNIVVMDFFEAAKLRGENLSYLVFHEIMPNAVAPLLAEFGLRFCFVFLTISSLSFLGIGIQPPLADWGTMVRDLSQFINFAAFSPLTASLPLMAAGAIALLTVAVNFVVDWVLQMTSGLKD